MSDTAKTAAPQAAAAEAPPAAPRRELTRQQKAAAIIVSLGTEKASRLYQYMDPEDVEQITLEVADRKSTRLNSSHPSSSRMPSSA